MKIELVTADEAIYIGLTISRLFKEGHGAFGEPDNSYENIVYVGKESICLSDNDLILFQGESPNREVIQVIKEWDCSDRLLEIINPTLLKNRKENKYKRYLNLKEEIETDDFYKSQI